MTIVSDISGKLVLITGAAGALGRQAAIQFTKLGAKAVLLDISEKQLKEIASELSCEYEVVNLLKESEILQVVESIMENNGQIDILLNIAGGFTMGGKTHETSEKTFDKMMDINAKTMWLVSKIVLSRMQSNGSGIIVNVASPAGQSGVAHMGPYSASKSVVMRMTETMAKEYKNNGIRVNSILPGTIDTPQNRLDMPDADFESWVKPKQLVDVMVFLCSNAASAISGANIPVLGLTM